MDVYKLLVRFVTHKGNGQAKGMKARSKVFLTSSENILIETFQHSLPFVFGKVSAGTPVMTMAGEKVSMLPGLNSEQSWCTTDNSSGLKVFLEEQMDKVIEQLNQMIVEQVKGADIQVISLTNILLAQSTSFAHELSNYITMTLTELGTSGFDKGDVWFLVSKLLFCMFAINF